MSQFTTERQYIKKKNNKKKQKTGTDRKLKRLFFQNRANMRIAAFRINLRGKMK